MSPFFIHLNQKKRTHKNEFFYKTKKLKQIVLASFLLSSLCMLPNLLHLPNRIRNQLEKTLTKIPLLGWLRKVKSLNTVKIQTCFPEF